MKIFDLDRETLGNELAGLFGALVSMRFLRGTWWERIATVLGGVVVSYYFAPTVAEKIGLPGPLCGFLVGLFGMAVLSRAWEWVQQTPIAALWEWVLGWLPRKKGTK